MTSLSWAISKKKKNQRMAKGNKATLVATVAYSLQTPALQRTRRNHDAQAVAEPVRCGLQRDSFRQLHKTTQCCGGVVKDGPNALSGNHSPFFLNVNSATFSPSSFSSSPWLSKPPNVSGAFQAEGREEGEENFQKTVRDNQKFAARSIPNTSWDTRSNMSTFSQGPRVPSSRTVGGWFGEMGVLGRRCWRRLVGQLTLAAMFL
jgi:hypothetical protein